MECFKVYANEIEGRLDPAFYSIGLKHIKTNITNLIKIEDIIEIQGGFAFKSSEYTNKGVPLVRIQNITDGEIKLTDTVFVEEKYKKDLVRFLLNENDILIAMTGATIGKIGRINKNNLPAFLNQRVGRFVFKSNNINKDYIYYILQLPIFQDQVKRLSLGGAQPNISPNSITNIQIPLPPLEIQNKIVQLMDNAYSLNKLKEAEAQKLLDSTSDYVLDELGIKVPELKDKMCFIVDSEEIKGKRIDPKGYSEIPRGILKAIKKAKYSQKTLSNLIEKSISGEWGEEIEEVKDKENYVLVKVLRNTNFYNQGNLDFSEVAQRMIDKEKFEKVRLKNGDILVEKSGGSPIQPVGRVAIIEDVKIDFAFSNFLQAIQIKKQECLPEYLFCFLRTLYSLNYMEYIQNQTTGIKNLIMEEFLSIPVSLPPMNKQKEIAREYKNRLEAAEQLKLEAKSILEEAKEKVERIILGGDE
jgi:type I restriction enzyme S subunit